MKTTKTTLFPIEKPNLAMNNEIAPQEVKDFFSPSLSIYPPEELVTPMSELQYEVFIGVIEFVSRTNNSDFKFCIGDINYRIMTGLAFFQLCHNHVIDYATDFFGLVGDIPELLDTHKLIDFFQSKEMLHKVIRYEHDQTIMINLNGNVEFFHLLS